MIRRSGPVLLLLGVLLLPAGSLADEGELAVEHGDLTEVHYRSREGCGGVEARRLCRQLDEAVVRALRFLHLSRYDIGFGSGVRPKWLAVFGDGPIVIRGDTGAGLPVAPGLRQYLKRLRRGFMVIPVLPDTNPEDPANRIRRSEEVAAAVVGNALGDHAPLWLSSGLTDVLAEELAGRKTPRIERYEKQLLEEQLTVEWSSLLSQTDWKAFLSTRLPALSYEVVRLLVETEPGFIESLFDAVRYLGSAAYVEPAPGAIRKEITEWSAAWMESAGLAMRRLESAFATFAEAGFPRDAELRRLRLSRLLGRLKPIPRVGVFLDDLRFVGPQPVSRKLLPDPTREVVWRLPHSTRIRMWYGEHEKAHRLTPGRSVIGVDGRLVSDEQWIWDVDERGHRKLKTFFDFDEYPTRSLDESNSVAAEAGNAIFFMATMRSRNGVGYFFIREWFF